MAQNRSKKRVFLSVSQKITIAEKLKNRVSAKLLSDEYGVSRDVIHRIRREYRQLLNFGNRGGHLLQHKNRRTSLNEELENRLYSWILQQRTIGNRISDLILQEKANEFSNEHGSTSFTGSRGWINKFKSRYGVRLGWAHREEGSADEEGAKQFIETFKSRFQQEDMNACLIYNMDETGLLWKTVPTKSLITREERTLTGEKAKEDRVSIGLCANATGTHKLPPIFVHEFQNPRALKNCRDLPVVYRSQRKACMNSDIFKEWYEQQFKPSVRQYQLENGVVGKVILFVDNCSSHRIIENEDNFEIIYLPPNTTPLIQPMDQGVIAKFKALYRHKILRRILRYERGIDEFYSQFNIKDCINYVHESWLDVTPVNIQNSWNKILGRDYRDEEQIEANAYNISIVHSDISEIIDPITGQSTNYEECRQILEHLEKEETINKNDIEQNIKEEEEQEEEVGEQEEEVYEQEEQNRIQVADRSEEEIEDQAEEIESKDFNQINAIEEKKKDLDLLQHVIQKYANNNPATLIMGDAMRKILENETPQIKNGYP